MLLIYARPTLPLTLLAISKTTDIFMPGQEKGLVYFCSERGLVGGGRDQGLGEHIIVPKNGTLLLTHIL